MTAQLTPEHRAEAVVEILNLRQQHRWTAAHRAVDALCDKVWSQGYDEGVAAGRASVLANAALLCAGCRKPIYGPGHYHEQCDPSVCEPQQ